MVQVMNYKKIDYVVALVVRSRRVLTGVLTKARHMAGRLERDNINRNSYGEKALNFGLERDRNCEY